MTDHVLTALVERRRVMLGEMNTTQQRLYILQADLAALDAVIKQFDPDYELSTIRAKYKRQTPGEHGAISRSVLDVLRRAESPMSAAEIAEQIMRSRGLDPTIPKVRRQMNKRVDMALRYQRTNGMVREVSADGVVVAWEIDGG